MLEMNNWVVRVPLARDREIGFTGEHLARRIAIRADVPGWNCKLDLEFEDGRRNILDLADEGGVLAAVLRREYIPCAGEVRAQVRGRARGGGGEKQCFHPDRGGGRHVVGV